ncbi:hypothetical protein TBLA_0C01680 [Henningerozyma blattae CBS 6284]|uniref:DNA polymerase delta subunit 3 n=1 Tax=Henningerozyma blattae (strain ATCC 34711 / CBS 6284 / DSM 70876 / NBRC 10599 / NRRL Y-10934 / UCD 77-7) TaxID=1071380 RepID=I2H0T0_HENB6|nr:hypothetical protein TBLA_0C01680 [Tetrapisispora blattae CBS 6284]CCH59982.1 hypothetical protein TBLA_0C01680 [Tetrapisispora blattae CBS 6284]
MLEISNKDQIFQYIEKQIGKGITIQFQDLIFQFQIGPSQAKQLLYDYYKTIKCANDDSNDSKTHDFNLVIVAVYKSGNIKVINDVNNIPNKSELLDCFIYGFNPTDSFIPTNQLMDQTVFINLRNPVTLKIPEGTPTIIDSASSDAPTTTPTDKIKPPLEKLDPFSSMKQRSKTVGTSTESKEADKTNPISSGSAKRSKTIPSDTGLRSTAILARMRKQREEKENERKEQLNRRKEELIEKQKETEAKDSTKKREQLKDLNTLFVDASDEEIEDKESNTNNSNKDGTDPHLYKELSKTSTKNPQSTELNEEELAELLDTTTEASILEISKSDAQKGVDNDNQEKITTSNPLEKKIDTEVVRDEEGYILSTRKQPQAQSSPVQKRTYSSPSTTNSATKKPRTSNKKQRQSTLTGFFKLAK